MNANDISNPLLKHKKRQLREEIQRHIDNIYKKIHYSSNMGYDYIWYNIDSSYALNIELLCTYIMKELIKNEFEIRLFDPYLLQILWKI